MLGLLLLLATSLPDRTSVVATTDGVFVARPFQEAVLVATPAALGVSSLAQPSITWISGTDVFVLTTRDGEGAAGLWRLLIDDTGPALVEDMTPSVTITPAPSFADADYAPGLDTLFVLDRANGTILAWPRPTVLSAAVLAPWSDVTALTARSLAVNASRYPFGVVHIERLGGLAKVTRIDATGVELVDDDAGWHDATGNPITGDFYLAGEASNVVGQLFPSGIGPDLVIDFNSWGLCTHPARKPVDVTWDPLDRQIVILAEDGILACLGVGALGDNHVVRMPIAFGGPQSPLLLTSTGFSQITGTEGDLAYVRKSPPDVTWFGLAGTTGAGSEVVLGNGGGYTGEPLLGDTMTTLLEGGPPSASGFVVFGLAPVLGMLQGQTFLPLPQLLVPVATDALGEAFFPIPIPAGAPELIGVRVYSQWWLPDTTTPGATDLVGSNGGIYTIGS